MLNANKTMAIMVIVVVLLAAVIFLVLNEKKETVEFKTGNKINKETFVELFAQAKKIYIVMDARKASSDFVNRNIFQCGVDFAGSPGLVGKNITYVGIDSKNTCLYVSSSGGKNMTTTPNECIRMINEEDGISLYIKEGNETEYYTRGAVVGVGETYALGTCSISIKQ